MDLNLVERLPFLAERALDGLGASPVSGGAFIYQQASAP